MGKLVKVGLGIVAALVAVVVLVVGAFALFFDPNDFRGRITAETKKATGRDLTLGDIRLGIYPVLGARIRDARLGNAPGFGDAPFAAVGEAEVGVQILPLLLHREVRVDSLRLKGLTLNAAKDQSGRSNWDDLAQGGGKSAQPEQPAPKGEGIKSIDVAGITISDAAISYVDAQAGTSYQLSNLQLKTGAIRPGKPFDFALEFATAVAKPAVNANVSVGATLALDLEKQSFVADKLSLRLKAAMPDLKADVTAASNVTADLASKLFKVEKIVVGVVAEGTNLPGGKQKLDFTGDAIYDGSKGTLKLAGGELAAAGLNATLALDGTGLNGDAPRFTGPLLIKPFNARELLAQLGTRLDTADPAALKDVSLKAKLDAGKQSVRVNDLVLKLDQSTLSGTAAITDLDTQAAEFALKLDAIDADRYLAPKPAAAATPTPAEKAKAESEPLPVDALDKLDAAGTLDIGKLKLSGLSMTAVRLKLDAAHGREKRVDLAASLYGGSLATTTRIAPGARPGYVETLRLNSIAAGPLLKDFNGKESLSGKGDVALDVTSSGRSVGEIKRALNGTVSFKFIDGAVKGFNLGQILRKGQAFLRGEQFSDTEPQQTDFSEVSASGRITNGVLQSDALDAKSPLFRLDGAGKVDLVNETVDYLAKPTVVNTASGQGGKDLADLAGIVIPIHITGPWSAPKYTLDLKTALQQKATEKLRGRLGEQLDKKLGDSPLKEQLQQGLESLFGRKKKAEPAPAPTPAPAPAPSPGT